jgi:hypothetical protein
MKRDFARPIITIVAVAMAAGHLIWPNLRIDPVTFGLFLVAGLPWLASVVRSIEVPGVGKIEMQELERRVERAEGAVASAEIKSETALQQVAQPSLPQSAGEEALVELSGLVKQYAEARSQQPRSTARTHYLTQLVGSAIDKSGRISTEALRISDRIASQEEGERVIGYALAFARPDANIFRRLAYQATRESGFAQYWALLALGKTLPLVRNPVEIAEALKNMRIALRNLPRGSDRHFEMERLIEDIESRLYAVGLPSIEG